MHPHVRPVLPRGFLWWRRSAGRMVMFEPPLRPLPDTVLDMDLSITLTRSVWIDTKSRRLRPELRRYCEWDQHFILPIIAARISRDSEVPKSVFCDFYCNAGWRTFFSIALRFDPNYGDADQVLEVFCRRMMPCSVFLSHLQCPDFGSCTGFRGLCCRGWIR